MALKNCKECGRVVSSNAPSCPHCGAVLKKKIGCLGYIGALFLICIIFGVMTDEPEENGARTSNASSPFPSSPAQGSRSEEIKEIKVYHEGEAVFVGYTSYAVNRCWWSPFLSYNPYINQGPDAMYLFIDLEVRNDDTKPRTIPPFMLVDERGAEYESSSDGWAVSGSIGALDSLNPSVIKQGLVVFDVPQGPKYRLKLSGGYWSNEEAFVQLNPSAKGQ